MYRTATYWPPGSWEENAPRGQNVAVQIQGLWSLERGEVEVYLKTDVAEGGYIYDGISHARDPRLVSGAYKIDLFLSHPDIASLKQVRKAIVS